MSDEYGPLGSCSAGCRLGGTWGAVHLADPLKKLRRQWGFSVAAGGSFIGIANRESLSACLKYPE